MTQRRGLLLASLLLAARAQATDGVALNRGALDPFPVYVGNSTNAAGSATIQGPVVDLIFAAWVHASATLNTVGTAASNWTAHTTATTDYANNFATHLWRHNGPYYDENPAFAYSAAPTTAYYTRLQIGGTPKWAAAAIDRFACQVQAGTSFTTPEVTPTTDGQQIIGIFTGRFATAPTWTPPATTTEWSDSTTGATPNIVSIEVVDTLQTTAAAIAYTATATQSATTGVACILTLKAATNALAVAPAIPPTSAIVGWVTKSATAANTYFNFGGPMSTTSTGETNRTWVPVSAGRLSNLHCYAATAPSGANQTYAFYVRNDTGSPGDTALTCSPGAGGQACSDTTHTVDYHRGDRITLVSRNAITTTGTGSVVCTAEVTQNGGAAGHYGIYGNTATDDTSGGTYTWRTWGTSDVGQGYIASYNGSTGLGIYGYEAMQMWGRRMYGAGTVVGLSASWQADYAASQSYWLYAGGVNGYIDLFLGGALTRGGTNRTIFTGNCYGNCSYGDDEQIGVLTRHTTRSYGQGVVSFETSSPQTLGTTAKLYRDAATTVKYVPLLGDVTTAAQDAFRMPQTVAIGAMQVDVNSGRATAMPQALTVDFCSGSTVAGMTCGAAAGKPSCTTSGANALPQHNGAQGTGRFNHACVDTVFTSVPQGDYTTFKVTNSASAISTLDYLKITVAALNVAAAPPTLTSTPTITPTPTVTPTATHTPTPTPMPTCQTPGMVVAVQEKAPGKCGMGGSLGYGWGCSGGAWNENNVTEEFDETTSAARVCGDADADAGYAYNTGHWGASFCYHCYEYGFTIPADAEIKGIETEIWQRRKLDTLSVYGPVHAVHTTGAYDEDKGYCPSYVTQEHEYCTVPPETMHYPPYGSYEHLVLGSPVDDWKESGHVQDAGDINAAWWGTTVQYHIGYRAWEQLRIDCMKERVYYCAVPTETPTPGPTPTVTDTPTETPTVDPDAPTPTRAPSKTPTEPWGTPTRTRTATPLGGVPTATPVRDEKVTTHRFQSTCGTFEAVTAGSKAERCLNWNIVGDADALGTSAADFTSWCEVQGTATPVTIPVVVDRLTQQTTAQVCAVLFNRNATLDQPGSWCCHAYRWGTTP